MRSGYVYSGHGSLRRSGVDSNYWSSYPYVDSLQYTYYLDFNNATVNPAHRYARVYGFSVCIVGYFSILSWS